MTKVRNKFSPEEKIARAKAALANAQLKLREQKEKEYWNTWHDVRNSLSRFEAVAAQVDQELAALYFPRITIDDGYADSPDERLLVAYNMVCGEFDEYDDHDHQLSAMAAGVKASHETFANLYRDDVEGAIKAYFALSEVERDAAIDAKITTDAENNRERAERRAEFEAEVKLEEDKESESLRALT
jgi:hypothetical protein